MIGWVCWARRGGWSFILRRRLRLGLHRLLGVRMMSWTESDAVMSFQTEGCFA